MTPPASKRLASERFRLLIRQLMRGGKVTQDDVAKRLGISQSMVSKLMLGEREAGADITERACRQLALDPRFFYVKDLADLDWVKNRTQAPFGEDSAQGGVSVHEVVEELIEREGERMSEAHKQELRAIYFGPREPTPDMVRALWREMVARDASS